MTDTSDRPVEYVDGCDSTTRRELHVASAIDPEVTRERGYETITRPSTADQRPRQRMEELNIPTWATKEDRFFPGILIPIWGPTGRVVSHQFKPRVPATNREGKGMKYASAKGQSSRLDVHPRWTVLSEEVVPPIRDVKRPLFITEGIKKADALTTQGYVTVGLNGVYNWRSSMGTLGDWEDVPVKGRNVGIVFDADALTNRNVRAAGARLKKWLMSKGAAKVRFFIPPAEFNGKPSKGVDDYFAAGATKADFVALSLPNMPDPVEDGAQFTDARMADRYADEVLSGNFLYVPGVGWRRWTGKRWENVDDAVPRNQMREHAITQYAEALRWKAELVEARKDATRAEEAADGWSSAQGKSRLVSALDLASGIPELRREVGDFDQDADLLNTPDGIVELRTSRLGAHDPERLMTRITAVGYDPAAKDDAFTTVLTSVSPDATDWLQIQLGQGLTGHHSDKLVMLTGVGRNGKSKLMGVLTRSLGANLADDAGYASIVPNTLLLTPTERSGPTPEKMTLLGLRLAYMEETPEDGILNANMLKEVVDAENISARQLYQKQVSFRPQHSLFMNTNHPPQVNGTDTAIWRRLHRVDFPYRFRLPNDGLGEALDIDRPGMVGMAQKLSTDEAHRAALAWLVEGAKRWYELNDADEEAPVPTSVHLSVRKWREDTDDVLAFYAEHLVPQLGSWVWSTELYEVYAEWAKSRGSRTPMSQKTFAGRLVAHTALPGIVSKAQKRVQQEGRSTRQVATNQWLAAGQKETHEPPSGRGWAFTGVRWKKPGEDGL